MLATMAPGMSYAIAAKLAYPDRLSVAVVGDGGFAMLMAELTTAVANKLPVKIVILKNNSLAEVKFEQKEIGNPEYGCTLSPIDFVAFAKACGADGFRCERPDEVRGAIQAALISPGPAIVEAVVDAEEKPAKPDEFEGLTLWRKRVCTSGSNGSSEITAEADLVERMAKKHEVSPTAVEIVPSALRSGGGRMAQSSQADFGVMPQWSPGMSMVGDIFNTNLNAKLDALCSDLTEQLAPSGGRSGASDPVDVSYHSESRPVEWRPAGLGTPGAVGSQNNLRHAVSPETRRLLIHDHGSVLVFDAGDHRIFGAAQVQFSERTISFTSQDGLFR